MSQSIKTLHNKIAQLNLLVSQGVAQAREVINLSSVEWFDSLVNNAYDLTQFNATSNTQYNLNNVKQYISGSIIQSNPGSNGLPYVLADSYRPLGAGYADTATGQISNLGDGAIYVGEQIKSYNTYFVLNVMMIQGSQPSISAPSAQYIRIFTFRGSTASALNNWLTINNVDDINGMSYTNPNAGYGDMTSLGTTHTIMSSGTTPQNTVINNLIQLQVGSFTNNRSISFTFSQPIIAPKNYKYILESGVSPNAGITYNYKLVDEDNANQVLNYLYYDGLTNGISPNYNGYILDATTGAELHKICFKYNAGNDGIKSNSFFEYYNNTPPQNTHFDKNTNIVVEQINLVFSNYIGSNNHTYRVLDTNNNINYYLTQTGILTYNYFLNDGGSVFKTATLDTSLSGDRLLFNDGSHYDFTGDLGISLISFRAYHSPQILELNDKIYHQLMGYNNKNYYIDYESPNSGTFCEVDSLNNIMLGTWNYIKGKLKFFDNNNKLFIYLINADNDVRDQYHIYRRHHTQQRLSDPQY